MNCFIIPIIKVAAFHVRIKLNYLKDLGFFFFLVTILRKYNKHINYYEN
jgi:hypothetical protein